MWNSFQPEKPANLTQGEESLVIHYANEPSEAPIGAGLSEPQQFSRYTGEGGIVKYGGGAEKVPLGLFFN